MADLSTPMTPQDHVLCMCALALVNAPYHTEDCVAKEKMFLSILADVIDQAGENPKVQAVQAAAADLLQRPRHPSPPVMLRMALADWAEWRLGLALAAIENRPDPDTPNPKEEADHAKEK